MARFDRRVLLVSAEHDYADPARGPSYSRQYLWPALQELTGDCQPCWIDAAWHSAGACDTQILAAVDRLRPDLVWVTPYEHDISHAVLQRLLERTTTVGFMSDDHWQFDFYGSHYARLYTHVATTEPRCLARYRALGGSPILTQYAALAAGCEAPPTGPDGPFLHDVCFVGLAHPWRAWLVDWLRARRVDVACYGRGWQGGRVEYAAMPELFRRSRINLNLSNSRQHDTRYLLADPRNFLESRETRKVVEQIKGRHFELAMAGGFQLSFYTLGLERYLEIGREVAIYSSPEDCLAQIEIHLADADERCAIARRAWERAHREHTWTERVAAVLGEIWPGAEQRADAA
jgi:spore maturation protein CgeB